MLLLEGISNIKSKLEVRNGKLDNEVGGGNNLTSHLTNLASHFSPLTSFPRNWKSTPGFGLIEFMIVITVFGIATAVITASFLTFERNQRLKSAASMLKNDIRLVQNKALSGDKGVNDGSGGLPNYCPDDSLLVGWYVKITDEALSYTISGDCLTPTGEADFSSKDISLPRNVKIDSISYDISSPTEVNVLFRPLSSSVSIHDQLADGPPPDFLDDAENLKNILGSPSDLVITLSAPNVTNPYQVIVRPTGEVNEQKL